VRSTQRHTMYSARRHDSPVRIVMHGCPYECGQVDSKQDRQAVVTKQNQKRMSFQATVAGGWMEDLLHGSWQATPQVLGLHREDTKRTASQPT
jgi:hypothetical protein